MSLFSMPLAVRYILLSALGFALMTATVKLVGAYGIPVLEIVAARALVSLAISYADIRRRGVAVWGQHHGLLIARGSIGAVSLICVYYAVTTLPLAEATLLQYTYPAFTALIAWLFLKEPAQRATLVCIALSFVGLMVMVQPGGSQMALPGLSVVAALLGAFGTAAAYVIVRRLGQRGEDSSVIIFYFPLIALPVSLLLLGDEFVMPGLEAAVLLVLVGIFTQMGQIGMTKAMALENASKVSAYSYVQVLFSTLLGLLLFAEWPTSWTLLGGGLIMAGALINARWKR